MSHVWMKLGKNCKINAFSTVNGEYSSYIKELIFIFGFLNFLLNIFLFK